MKRFTFIITALLLATATMMAKEFTLGKLKFKTLSDTKVELVGAVNKGITNLDLNSAITYQGKSYSLTSIGEYAFEACSSLTSITIPNSVTSIGDWAFSGCSRLTSITIPNSVTSIGWLAFDGCSGLTSITIPNSVTSIGFAVFDGCSALNSITIPNSVTVIGTWAFKDCSSLTSITIPESVTSIGDEAFSGCAALTRVNYNGTQASWNLVERSLDWMVGSSIKFIHCWDVMIAMEEEIVELFGERVFVVVERMPEFPGGQQAMMKFLGENIKYPVNAQEKGIQGRVICKFVVEKDGNVSDIQVVRTSGDASLDSEAVRVISTMPKWKPGIQRGKPVRVKYTIPINFRLSDEPKEGAKP